MRHLLLLSSLVIVAPSAAIPAAAQAQAAPADAAADGPVVEPQSVAAMQRMSAYLATLQTAQITSEGSLDIVTEDGQRIQVDGVTNYKIRRPGFVIDFVSDAKTRRFFYDGKQFTVFAPKLGYYATVPAPATNKEVFDLIYDKYGIRLPLEDLVAWNDSERAKSLKSGYRVGTATIGGIATDHYAFREAAIDWEIWIQQGDQPLPRKLVIVDQTDPARPTFIARLQWKVNPPLADSDFSFVPDKDSKRIELATYQGSGE